MSGHPRISIGMPVYNGGAYIREALDSLLAQSYTDFEIVISDNASTDETAEICSYYAAKDCRIRYFRQEKNAGPAGNFKFVFDVSIGEYFMWAACDDSWSPNWLQTLISNFAPEDVGVFGEYVEGQGEASRPKCYNAGDYVQFFRDSDLTGKCFYIYALFRRKIVALSRFDFWLCPVGADQIYLLQLLRFGRLRSVPGARLSYRLHEASVSVQQSALRGLIRMALSRYPLTYYLMSIQAVPFPAKVLMPLHIVRKYVMEQSILMTRLGRRAIRKIMS